MKENEGTLYDDGSGWDSFTKGTDMNFGNYHGIMWWEDLPLCLSEPRFFTTYRMWKWCDGVDVLAHERLEDGLTRVVSVQFSPWKKRAPMPAVLSAGVELGAAA
jgi:hypothetical protein